MLVFDQKQQHGWWNAVQSDTPPKDFIQPR